MQINYYINNQDVNRPLNHEELSVELNYDKDDPNTTAVSLTEFEWGLGDQTDGNDAARLINAHRTGGLGTGVGVFEGLPFRIELTKDSTTYQLFEGYLDTAGALYDCDRVITTAVESGNVDWLNEVADSVTFAYLYDQGNITNADFISIPYVLSELPNNREAFLAAVSLFLITETITSQLQELIGNITGAAAGDPTELVKAILRAIYITGLLLAAYSLILQIINLLIQPTKYHDGMRVKTLCEKGAAHFGLNFSSSILNSDDWKDLIIIPEKYNHDVNESKDDILGFLSPNDTNARGYYNGTYGDLLRGLKEMFNAKIIFDGNTLRLEREDYNNSAYNYVTPPIDDTDFRLNKDELKSNYTIEFLTDINDKNTLQRYEGTITQVITTPRSIINKDMVLMSGLERRFIPFARCTRKEGLTIPEKLLEQLATAVDFVANQIVDLWNAFIDVIDDIISIIDSVLGIIGIGLQDVIDFILDLLEDVGITTIFGKEIILDLDNLPTLSWTNLGDSISDRDGMLSMENDFIDIPKIGLFNVSSTPRSTDVSTNDAVRVQSEYLWDNYHFLRSFVQGSTNQHKLYGLEEVPFCFDDYELLRNNNYLQDDEGRDGELISLRWNPFREVASIDYKINEKYTDNLKQDIITPDGK